MAYKTNSTPDWKPTHALAEDMVPDGEGGWTLPADWGAIDTGDGKKLTLDYLLGAVADVPWLPTPTKTIRPRRQGPHTPPPPPPPPPAPRRRQKVVRAEFATLTDRNGQPIPDGRIVDPEGDFDLEIRDYRGAKKDDPRILHFPGLNLDMPRAVRIAWRDWYFDSPDDFDPTALPREATVTVTRDRIVFGSFKDLPLRPRGFNAALFAAIRRLEPWFLFSPATKATGGAR